MSESRTKPGGATRIVVTDAGVVVALPFRDCWLEVGNARVWARTGVDTLAADAARTTDNATEDPTGVWTGEDDSYANGAIHPLRANQDTHTHVSLKTLTGQTAICYLRRRSR